MSSFLTFLSLFRHIHSTLRRTRLPTGWTVRGSNSGGDEIFRTCPDRPEAHPASSKIGTGSFPGYSAAGAWSWPFTLF